MRNRLSSVPAVPGATAERLDRAATLLLATSALAAAALVGWGGPTLNLQPLALIAESLYHAVGAGNPGAPGVGEAIAALRWDDLGPLLGTFLTLLFWWHAVSLVAEIVLLLAASLGWLWNRSLRPLWVILDILDSAPLAAPKRIVVATALAGQILVRSAAPTLAAPMPPPATLVTEQVQDDQPSPSTLVPARAVVSDTLGSGLSHRVERGDTLSSIAARYYGHPGAWPVLFKANEGATMAIPTLGMGRPVRLTTPNYLLPGWDMVIPPLDGHLEQGDEGELTYVVQQGDTLSGIAERFGVDVDELAAANMGAEAPNGRVFMEPDLIWPGLHLRVRPLEPESAPVEVTPAQMELPTTVESAPVLDTPAPLPKPEVTEVPSSPPAAPPDLAIEYAMPTSTAAAEAPWTIAPAYERPPLSTAGQPGSGSRQWPLVLAAGGLSAAALLALQARRTRSRRAEPESDTELDGQAFTLAAPAAVVAARHGGAEDPHGVVLGEQVVGALLRHAAAAGLTDIHVVSVKVGRTGCTVVLETSIEQRPRLEATLRTALHLARRLTVSRSADQDVVAQLEGIRHAALRHVPLEECPLLLCIGLQLDTRAYLVGWEALGDVLVATQPGTSDAREHLASLVATLAGQCSPSELQLYTVAPADSLLGQLAPLPHQRAVIDPLDELATAHLIASLRAEVERRRRGVVSPTDPELVLVASELGQLGAEQDLTYVLEHGRACRVRVLAATADTAVQRGSLVDLFETRLVFALEDEEASTKLLGRPWALTLAEPGRLLARLGRRNEVEIFGFHLTEEGRRDLLATMGVGEDPPSASAPGNRSDEREVGDAVPESGAVSGESVETDDKFVSVAEPTPSRALASLDEVGQEPASESPLPVDFNPPGMNGEAVVESEPTLELIAPEEPAFRTPPTRIVRLLQRAPLVIDCEDAAIWSLQGRLRIEPSRPLELMFYLAAAPLLEQRTLDQWPGSQVDTVLQEVWAAGARDPENRESGQAWLVKTLGRLQEEIGRNSGSSLVADIVKRAGAIRVNREVAISDVEAFMSAVERARSARGLDQVAAAEEAVVLRVPDLLPRARMERRGVAKKRIELYRWMAEPHWEHAAGRLQALGREAAGLLARAYRDAARHEEALAVYAQLLSEDPLDSRAQEGLLSAAAGTGDVARLHDAWQQVCACLEGEDDPEVRAHYEGLLRDMEHGASARTFERRTAVGVAER